MSMPRVRLLSPASDAKPLVSGLSPVVEEVAQRPSVRTISPSGRGGWAGASAVSVADWYASIMQASQLSATQMTT